jgi:hypothetical protein
VDWSVVWCCERVVSAFHAAADGRGGVRDLYKCG